MNGDSQPQGGPLAVNFPNARLSESNFGFRLLDPRGDRSGLAGCTVCCCCGTPGCLLKRITALTGLGQCPRCQLQRIAGIICGFKRCVLR